MYLFQSNQSYELLLYDIPNLQKGYPPIRIAFICKNCDMLEYLLLRRAQYTSYHDSVSFRKYFIFSRFESDLQQIFNNCAQRGRNLFFLACMEKQYDIAFMLLRWNIDLYEPDAKQVSLIITFAFESRIILPSMFVKKDLKE